MIDQQEALLEKVGELADAIDNQDVAAIRLLSADAAVFSVRLGGEQQLLERCAYTGNLDAFQILWAKAHDALDGDDKAFAEAFRTAVIAGRGRLPIIEFCLAQGFDPFLGANRRPAPIKKVVRLGLKEVFTACIKGRAAAGLNAAVLGEWQWGCEEAVRLGADPKVDGTNALAAALDRKVFGVLAWLLEEGAIADSPVVRAAVERFLTETAVAAMNVTTVEKVVGVLINAGMRLDAASCKGVIRVCESLEFAEFILEHGVDADKLRAAAQKKGNAELAGFAMAWKAEALVRSRLRLAKSAGAVQ